MYRKIADETSLDEALSIPGNGLVEMMRRLEGDIMILGINGKMGGTMGRQAVNAIREAGVSKKVYGVSRFTDVAAREQLSSWGIETIACDLLDASNVAALPQVKNIIFMAGRKFGTNGSEEQTWAMNALTPAITAEHFKNSHIVAFSTGCVYPLVSALEGGCTEKVAPEPVGEYSQSCLARERVFEYYSKKNGTKMLMFRLNYAIALRYGVLHDIALPIWKGEPVNRTVGHFNVIWQGDANCYALRCLEHVSNPPAVLNITGPETVSVEAIAERFGELMGKEVRYVGEPGNKCYLNNAGKAMSLFGYPRVSLDEMIVMQSEWLMGGGRSLGKPTHFEVNNGKF